jgi:hypothetical protein
MWSYKTHTTKDMPKANPWWNLYKLSDNDICAFVGIQILDEWKNKWVVAGWRMIDNRTNDDITREEWIQINCLNVASQDTCTETDRAKEISHLVQHFYQ